MAAWGTSGSMPMSWSLWRPLPFLAMNALAMLCWWAFFQGLDIPGPVDKTEALQTEIARRMAIEGDWIPPTWNREPYVDKPVWPYGLDGLGFRLLGVQPWAARVPAALTPSLGTHSGP